MKWDLGLIYYSLYYSTSGQGVEPEILTVSNPMDSKASKLIEIKN